MFARSILCCCFLAVVHAFDTVELDLVSGSDANSLISPFGLRNKLRRLLNLEDEEHPTLLQNHNASRNKAFLEVVSFEEEQDGSDEEGGRCRGHRYTWMAEVQRMCERDFGTNSMWKADTRKCERGLKSCTTHLYTECCSKPNGPKTLDTYCNMEEDRIASEPHTGPLGKNLASRIKDHAKEQGTKLPGTVLDHSAIDPACEINPVVKDIQKKVQGINLMLDPLENSDGEEVAPTTAAPPATVPVAPAPAPAASLSVGSEGSTDYATWTEEALRAELRRRGISVDGVEADWTMADMISKLEESDGQAATQAATSPAAANQADQEDDSEASGDDDADSADDSDASAADASQTSLQGAGATDSSLPGASPAAAPIASPGPAGAAPAPVPAPAAAKVSGVELCQEFEALVKDIEGDISKIAQLSVVSDDSEKEELEDPALLKRVRSILKAGEKLKEMPEVCSIRNIGAAGDDDDDDDDDLAARTATQPQVQVVSVDSDVLSLFYDWALEMEDSVQAIQTKVHPHGFKWWRYRWEYSALEMLFIIPCIILLYGINRGFDILFAALKNDSRHASTDSPRDEDDYDAFSFALVGNAGRYNRTWFSWWLLYAVQHVSALTALLFVVEALIPTSWYDKLAADVRYYCDADKPGFTGHLPYLGLSYMWTFADILFHLMGTVVMYAMFGMLISRRFAEICYEKKQQEDEAGVIGIDDPNLTPLQQLEFCLLLTLQMHHEFGTTKVQQILGDENSEIALIDMARSRYTEGHHGSQTQDMRGKSFRTSVASLNVQVIQKDMEGFPFYRYIHAVHNEVIEKLLAANAPVALGMILFAVIGNFCAVLFQVQSEVLLMPLVGLALVCTCSCIYLEHNLVRRADLFTDTEKTKNEVFMKALREFDDMDHFKKKPYELNVPQFSRRFQLILLTLCYSFMRVVLSRYMWRDHLAVTLWFCFGLCLILGAMWFKVAEIISMSTIALALPPNADPARVAWYLRQMPDERALKRYGAA